MNHARPGDTRSILAEAAAVAALGFALALGANALSPRGLVLTRDYFPGEPTPIGAQASSPSAASASRSPAVTDAAAPSSPSPTFPGPGAVEARVQARGFEVVPRSEVHALLQDPRYSQELIVFVDARDDRHYREGHIAGAFQLDRFRPEHYLPDILGPCLAAERIVVYCTGGDCDDSLFAAALLQDAGVPAERMGVYVGGIQDWQAAGLPIEIGERLSGELSRSPAPATSDSPSGSESAP